MAVGRKRDEWERAARLVSAWTGETVAEIMPDFGDGQSVRQSDVLPYNPALRDEIVKNWTWSG